MRTLFSISTMFAILTIFIVIMLSLMSTTAQAKDIIIGPTGHPMSFVLTIPDHMPDFNEKYQEKGTGRGLSKTLFEMHYPTGKGLNCYKLVVTIATRPDGTQRFKPVILLEYMDGKQRFWIYTSKGIPVEAKQEDCQALLKKIIEKERCRQQSRFNFNSSLLHII
jgi:hypothetical protein